MVGGAWTTYGVFGFTPQNHQTISAKQLQLIAYDSASAQWKPLKW